MVISQLAAGSWHWEVGNQQMASEVRKFKEAFIVIKLFGGNWRISKQ
jgi:hypothetical protein